MQNTNILNYAIEQGIIDPATLQRQIMAGKRKELLKNHCYKIWQGTDERWYTYLPDSRKGRRLIKRRTRTDLEDAISDYYLYKETSPSIREVFEEWNDRRRDLGKISPATHRRNVSCFKTFYSIIEEMRICDISPPMLSDFLEEQVPKHNLKAKAFSNLKSLTRGMFKRAKKRGFIEFSVDLVIGELDVSDSEYNHETLAEEDDVFLPKEQNIIENFLWRSDRIDDLGLLLMFGTGIRVGELTTLKAKDFQEDKYFYIRRTETEYNDIDGHRVYGVKDFPKTEAGKRLVVIPSKYQWIVSAMRKINPFTEFLMERDGKRIYGRLIRARLKRVCRLCNIKPKTPHKIRKTVASILLDNKVDTKFITAQLGHTDIACTEANYHRNRKSVDEKIRILDQIPDFHAI